jgi:trimeric autotransporter adhesin
MNGPPDGEAGLTRREREVAALVAEGLTNRQIGERLFISERTADGHLEHIREKLGVRSRSQVTAWFIEQGHEPGIARVPVKRRTSSRKRFGVAAAALVIVLLGTAAVASMRLVRLPLASAPEISTFAGGATPAGSLVGGYAGDNLRATEAQLYYPRNIAVTSDSVFIADWLNRVIRKVDGRGVITTVAGGGTTIPTDNAVATSVRLPPTQGVAIAPNGGVFICTGAQLFRLDPNRTIHIVPLPASDEPVQDCSSLANSPDGSLFLADRGGHTVRRLAPDGSLSIYAGTGAPGFSGDDMAAVGAQLYFPTALAVDAAGNLFIADQGNDRIRRVDVVTGRITTIAGSDDIYGFSGDGGPAIRARLGLPAGVAVDARGRLYIADTDNNRIRVVASDGIIRTIAGTGASGIAGDGGPATAARLFNPVGLALYGGNLLVADSGNNRVRLIRIAGGG